MEGVHVVGWAKESDGSPLVGSRGKAPACGVGKQNVKLVYKF